MTVGIYGLGRFGSFWAGLFSRDFDVVCYSRNTKRTAPPGTRRVSEDDACSADILFLCVAISAMEEVAASIAPKIRPSTIVADTCSVKVYPVTVMERTLRPGTQILATHPMFGPDSGKDGVAGLPMVYHPVRLNRQDDAYWYSVFESWELRMLRLTPDDHDREAAYTQGITHFIGRVLNDLKLKKSDIATIGYTKLLEIIEQTCNDPKQLFLDLQRFNPYTSDMRADLAASLDRTLGLLQDSIDSGNGS